MAARAKAKTRKPAVRRKKTTSAVTIRMYRLGVGDCFLLSLPGEGGRAFRMLIDCGVHQSQSGGAERIRAVVADLRTETGDHLDVVVATHEHWDHISGFAQAAEQFEKVSVGELWCAWTEKAGDPIAESLRGKRRQALAALGVAEARMRLAGHEGARNPLTGLLGFFGDTTGKKLQQAGAVLRRMAQDAVKYREPGEAPIELPGGQARVFVLGPPRSTEAIGRSAPRKGGGEVYLLGAFERTLDLIEPALRTECLCPFDNRFAIPLPATQSLPFFRERYWSERSPDAAGERVEATQDWRRIDDDWLGTATSLALKLDEDTNNTSLVLAIELGPPDRDGPVLLFAADAQVGNWLSWKDLRWDYEGRRITGPDLLRRTILYKVGHHASHNATLREMGLELMEALRVALVPTDDAMAEKVGWGTLPWPKLLERLGEKARDCVIRTDRPLPAGAGKLAVKETPLYYEIALSP